MSIDRCVAAVALPLVFVILGGMGASAHHSTAGYDLEHTIAMTGVVTEFIWINPHTFLVWVVTDADGNEVEWTGEMLSIQTVTSWGLTRRSFGAGDQVTITGFPSRTGTPHSMIQKIVMTADGSVVVDRTGNEDPDGIP